MRPRPASYEAPPSPGAVPNGDFRKIAQCMGVGNGLRGSFSGLFEAS